MGKPANVNCLFWTFPAIVCFSVFAGCEGKERSKGKVDTDRKMTEERKSALRAELKRDPEKEFGAEFIRTTDLEQALIDKYGFEAVKLIFEDHNREKFYQLGSLPASSPWAHLNGKSLQEAIETNFAPIAGRIPRLIRAMSERCRVIYAEKSNQGWRLHYLLDMSLYDGRKYHHVYTGGPPNPNPTINKNLVEYEWNIPEDLRDLYAIHDGFGPVLDSASIRVMAEMMDPICKEQNFYPEGYSYRDLLEFYPDGAGNAQCFLRGEDDTAATVDWDHEVWQISGPESFFQFIDERMSQLDEE